jgi:CheY-like chemotaxis protein
MRRILVVDDDPLIALDLADQLRLGSYTVIGPAHSVAAAMACLAEPRNCDAALLDIQLGRDTSEPIAQYLTAIGTPFLVISGYASHQHPAIFQAAPQLQKPIQPERLIAAVQKLLAPLRPPA